VSSLVAHELGYFAFIVEKDITTVVFDHNSRQVWFRSPSKGVKVFEGATDILFVSLRGLIQGQEIPRYMKHFISFSHGRVLATRYPVFK
jgi:hypothetical protein